MLNESLWLIKMTDTKEQEKKKKEYQMINNSFELEVNVNCE